MPPHHRGFSPLGSHRTVNGKSEWGGKNCSAEQKLRVSWSELGRSSRLENSSCWLTQGKSKAFPGKCCSHIPILSLHLEELSSHRAEGSSSLSCGTHSEVSASQHCTALLHTAVPCSAPLLGARGSPAPHFQRLLVRAGWSVADLTRIIPVSWSCWGKLQKQLRKTPEAATAHSPELFTGAWDGRNTALQNHFCSDGTGLVPVYSSKRVYSSPLAVKRSIGDWAVLVRCEYLYCLYKSCMDI